MTITETQFVTDDEGQRVAVLIGLERYRQLLDAFDELAAIRAYDAAKTANDQSLPFEEAVREIERNRTAE